MVVTEIDLGLMKYHYFAMPLLVWYATVML